MTNDARPTTGPQKTRKISVIQDRNRATLAHFGGILGILPSAAVFYVVCFILGFVPGLGNIALVLGMLVWLFMAIASVRAGIEVNRGEPYSYRVNPRLLDRVVKSN